MSNIPLNTFSSNIFRRILSRLASPLASSLTLTVPSLADTRTTLSLRLLRRTRTHVAACSTRQTLPSPLTIFLISSFDLAPWKKSPALPCWLAFSRYIIVWSKKTSFLRLPSTSRLVIKRPSPFGRPLLTKFLLRVHRKSFYSHAFLLCSPLSCLTNFHRTVYFTDYHYI